MRPATVRRLLVFGVCALGVAGLYLVPGVAGTPSRVAPPTADRDPRPTIRPVSTATTPAAEPLDPVSEPAGSSGSTVDTGEPAARPDQARPSSRPGGRRDAPASQATPQRERPDRQAPSSVTELSFPTVSPTAVTIRWPRATDNVGVVRYRVWLNGYQVADTAGLQVDVPWFNDGTREQVVQVRAVDDAGNQSTTAPARLVRRPDPEPSATPAPTTTRPTSEASQDPSSAPTTPASDPTPSVTGESGQ